MNNLHFGMVFDYLCNQSGKDNIVIADDLKVSPSTISRWRSGERTPKLSKLKEIADYFNIDPKIFTLSNMEQIDLQNQILYYQRSSKLDSIIMTSNAKKEEINQLLEQLNDAGHDAAIAQLKMLTKIDEYKK